MKRGSITWEQLFMMIIVLILLGISVYFARDIFETGQSISDCEGHAGTCKQVCHFPNEQPLSYSCEESTDLCCWDPDKPGGVEPEGESVTVPGMWENHKVYVYTNNGETVDRNPVVLSAGKSYTYYFSAEGEDVGVCYASIMQKVDGGQLKVLDQGGEKRIRLDRDECLKGSGTSNALTFHTNDPEYSNDNFYIQFIVFDKDLTEDADFFQANSNANGNNWWGQPTEDYRVANYRKDFTITDFGCDEYRTMEQCVNDNSCAYCPDGDQLNEFGTCLQTGETQTQKNQACASKCDLGSQIASFGEFTYGGVSIPMCIIDTYAETCSVYDNNKYQCAQQENCVFCTGGSSDGSGTCLESGTSNAEKNQVCFDDCDPSDSAFEGYYDPVQNQCSQRQETYPESICEGMTITQCKYQPSSCVWCRPLPVGNWPGCIPLLPSGSEQTCDSQCAVPGIDVEYDEPTNSCVLNPECSDIASENACGNQEGCEWCHVYETIFACFDESDGMC